MRRSLLVLSLLLIAACGSDDVEAPPPTPTPDAVVTPPPGAYDDDPLAAAPQEPLPDGVQPRPSPTPTPAPTPAVEEPTVIPTGALAVSEMVLADTIVDRKPAGVTDTFKDGSEVSCFTRIDNPQGHPRTIRHRYYFGDELKRSLPLKVKGTTWRTWSNKRVYGPGAWRVDVVDEHGTVLKSLPFTVN